MPHGASTSTAARNTARCWAMFVVLMLSGISVGLSQLKITPVMVELAAMLGVTVTDAAWLTSVFTLTGIVLSIPGAALIGKIGPKKTLLFMLAMLVCGNVLGALSSSFPVMFVSRLIEGTAAVFVIPVGMDFINRWFSGANVGIATGIFMTATPVATFLATSTGLTVAESFGSIKSLWWIIAVLDIVCILLVVLTVREMPRDLPAVEGGAPVNLGSEVRETLQAPALVLLCAAMFFLSYALYSLITCYPQLFVYYGLPEETSNLLTSLNGLVGIPMSIISGFIIGKTGKPYHVALVGAIGAIVTCATLPYLSDATYALNVIGSAVFPGGIVLSPLFVLAPLLVRRADLSPMATSIMNTFFYLGQLVSTPLTTALTGNNSSWLLPSLVLTASCIVFFILTFLSMRHMQVEATPSRAS